MKSSIFDYVKKSVIVWLSPHGQVMPRADNWKSKHSVEVQCFLCCPNRCDFVIVNNVCFGFKLFLQKGEEFRYISTSMIKLMNTEYNVHNFCLPKSAINKVYWTHVYNLYAQQITTFVILRHRKHSCASNNSDVPEQQREFWISSKWLKLLRKAGHLQLISVARRRQIDIRIHM